MTRDLKIIQGDCLVAMQKMKRETIGIIVTSPPYNLNINYGVYDDSKERQVYLVWLDSIFGELKRVLKADGSFFLNMGSSNRDPWIAIDVANVARQHFILQNHIIWVKSITINDRTYGHFKPINSERFTNHTFEHIFHFTKTGNIKINRKAIGVRYTDKSNIKRWKNKEDLRCRGNCWFIPYDTVQNQETKGHPCIFPISLVKMCIKLHGITPKTMVLDPFLGSGTTLVGCKELGVKGIGIEIDPTYCKKARERITCHKT